MSKTVQCKEGWCKPSNLKRFKINKWLALLRFSLTLVHWTTFGSKHTCYTPLKGNKGKTAKNGNFQRGGLWKWFWGRLYTTTVFTTKLQRVSSHYCNIKKKGHWVISISAQGIIRNFLLSSTLKDALTKGFTSWQPTQKYSSPEKHNVSSASKKVDMFIRRFLLTTTLPLSKNVALINT